MHQHSYFSRVLLNAVTVISLLCSHNTADSAVRYLKDMVYLVCGLSVKHPSETFDGFTYFSLRNLSQDYFVQLLMISKSPSVFAFQRPVHFDINVNK